MAADIPDFSHLPVTIRRWKFATRQSIEIDRDFVKVTEKGLFWANWEEPLSAFIGVLRRTETEVRGGGQYSQPVTVHFVELVHPSPAKTLRLC